MILSPEQRILVARGNEIARLEQQNAELLEALKWLDTAIMPEEREYGLYGYCMIHREILREIDGKIKQAIAKAEGDNNG